jgi:hypothetical protein
MDLIQRLAQITDEEALATVAKEEDETIDNDFFGLLSQIIQMSAAQGDQQSAAALSQLQQRLLPLTTAGKELQERQAEVDEVSQKLRDAGQELTREALLDMVIEAKSDLQIEAFANMARPVMDYQFFLTLSEKIDAAEGEEKETLTELREKLQAVTQAIDAQLQERLDMARKNVQILIDVEENLSEIIVQNLPAIDDFFLQALSIELEEARQKEDTKKVEKLQEIAAIVQDVLQAASLGPDGVLLEALLEAESEDERREVMEENADKVTPEFIETVTGMMMQLDNAEDEQSKQMLEQVRTVYREALRFSMKSQMSKE